MPITIQVNQNNPNKDFVNCGDFNIIGDFNAWYLVHYVENIPLTLDKFPGSPNDYNLFHANYCDSTDTLEIHVAKVYPGMLENFNHLYLVANIGSQFSLEPRVKQVSVKVLLYDICDRDTAKDDVYIWECGIETSTKVPPYDGVSHKCKVLTVDPEPKVKGTSILIGG